MAEPDQLGLGHGGGGRGARPRVEQAELAEHLARAEDGEQVLAAVDAGAAELDLALADDVQPVALVALVRTGRRRARGARADHRVRQGGRSLVVQGCEQRALFSRRLGPRRTVCHGAVLGRWLGRSALVLCRWCPRSRVPQHGDETPVALHPPRPPDVPRAARPLPLRPLRAGLPGPAASCWSRRCCRRRPRTCGSTWSTPALFAPLPDGRPTRRGRPRPSSSA